MNKKQRDNAANKHRGVGYDGMTNRDWQDSGDAVYTHSGMGYGGLYE